MDNRFFLSSTSSSLFDTYLVYGVIGLLLSIAVVGLIVLLTTSCCCSSCCHRSSSTSCCLSCYRRHSSYKLRQDLRRSKKATHHDKTRLAFVKRHPSDVADFSQLYESCPHLINSKAMSTKTTTTNGITMETSCTTIDTLISPISPCSSLRSFVGSGPSSNPTKSTPVQNDLSHLLQATHINNEKSTNILPPSSKNANGRPFSYIKNTTDRAQILRRFTPNEHSAPAPPSIPIEIRRLPSSDSDSEHQSHSASTNIYETVIATPNASPLLHIPTPIYETEWTHSLRQLMIPTSSLQENPTVSIIDLPNAPPDLLPTTSTTMNYFQQQNPYDKFLSGRAATSDSMRRTNMLRRLKDDAAFLY